MKLRLYHDTRKKFRFCVDAWTIYVPYPKWLRKERYDAKGIYLGCSPTEYGMIRCCWCDDEITITRNRPYLGKRIDPKTTSKAFQKIFYKLEKLWNEAITKNTDEAWKAWNEA